MILCPDDTFQAFVLIKGSELDLLIDDKFDNVLARQSILNYRVIMTLRVVLRSGTIVDQGQLPPLFGTGLDNQSELIIVLI